MALLLGWNPIGYMRLDGIERIAADAVLAKALSLRDERENELLSVLARSVGNATASAVAELLARTGQ